MKCPTCEQPTHWQDNPYRPFCSERCKLIDFGRWANGEYLVPGEPGALTEKERMGQKSHDDLPLEEE